VKPNSKDLNEASAESNDPKHQFLVQSTMTLPQGIEFGAVMRFIDDLPEPEISDYFGLDLRLGWNLNRVVQLSIVGQNLLKSSHVEFIASEQLPRNIERSVYGKISCRF
jgi:iron complex outermembrane receptor protein